MFFVRDGVGPRSSFEIPKPRFSLRAAEGPSLLRLFKQSLNRHPFNQQIYLVTAARPGGFSSSSSDALKEAVTQLASKSCCLCLRNVASDSFLSLELQQFLLKQLKASLLSWRGPASSAACRTTKNETSENLQRSCPVVGDGGGDKNIAALQSDGTLILKVDAFTAQVLGIDTRIHLPHFMRRILPPGTQYLKLSVQHPAILRHQQKLRKQQNQQKERNDMNENSLNPPDFTSFSSSSSCTFPPSRLFNQMQRSLQSLESMDFLAATTLPQEEGENNLEKRLAVARDVQTLLRASGSAAASCHLVQLECRLSIYRGGFMNMTDETGAASSAFDEENCEDSSEGSTGILLTPNLLTSYMPQQLLLPDWTELFTLATSAAPQHRVINNEEAKATVVVRRKNTLGVARRDGSRMRGGIIQEKQLDCGISSNKGGDADDRLHTKERSALLADSQRHFPPLHPPYLEGLQLLHERQRQARSEKKSTCKKKKQQIHTTAGESTEEEGQSNNHVVQLAAPPPFKKLPSTENLFSNVTEYLGCIALDIPANKDCGWLREADRISDPQGIHVASVSGGLLHSTAVIAAAESLYRWVKAEGQGAWAAVSVVGTAETSAVYTNQPHGSDLIGESTLHLLLTAEKTGEIRGMFLQTIAACDATTTLP